MAIDQLKNKRVFVSGAAGVIGQEMIPMLHDAGAVVLAADLKPMPLKFPQGICYRQGDLNEMTQQEISSFAPEIFIHLAATFERSTESYEFWYENFWHNVRLSNHLMTIMKDLSSLKRVVFASSYLIYDQSLYQFSAPQERPRKLAEDDSISPRNLTGMAKLSHEIELNFLNQFKSGSFSSVCARIFRGYGKNSRDVISRWIHSLLKNEEIKVYRKEGTFDYIYAADTAKGLLLLATNPALHGIINLGTGRSRSVNDVLKVLKTHFPSLRYKEIETDIPFEASEADITRLKQFISWQPEFDIESAIKEMVAYERHKIENCGSQHREGNVLVSSAANKVPLVQALKRAARKLNPKVKVFAGDIQENVLTRHVADGFIQMPRTKDGELQNILDLCKKENITAIIPSRDGELLFWARNAARFADAGVKIMISSPASTEACIDKFKFFEVCRSFGIPAIPTSLQASAFRENSLVVKERFGAGSKSLGLNLSYDEAIAHSAKLNQPIFQPYIPGMEISVDAYIDTNKVVKGVIMRKRQVVVNGESQLTTTFSDQKKEQQIRKYISDLDLRGHVILQLMIDSDDKMHIIECNARFGGASTLSLACGLDSFYWFLLEAQGSSIENAPFLRSKVELTQVRVANDLIFTASNI